MLGGPLARCASRRLLAVLPLAIAMVAVPAAAAPPAEADEYTRYELLAPESSQFHILYEVTATTPGATFFFNPIRQGSTASGEAVFDRATGRRLEFTVTSGSEAARSGLADAEPATSYIRVRLPRPVPTVGGVRLLIEKTYQDAKSYYREGADRIVFTRSLGIHRNAIILPAGHEVIACNFPAQLLAEPDGRLAVSFFHTGPDAAGLVLRARNMAAPPPPSRQPAPTPFPTPAAAPVPGQAPVSVPPRAPAADLSQAPAPAPNRPPLSVPPQAPAPARTQQTQQQADRQAERMAERAHQDREIVYFLRQPESHAFDLYHDYTESRPGTDKYLNVVRTGSTASQPSARNLDSGEPLTVETLRGAAITQARLDIGEEVRPDTEVVVARFPAVHAGESLRLRIAETYTDAASYGLHGDELVFDRSFGRPRNAVVLPAGWYLAASSIPATVSETSDGRIRLDFVNPRPDEIAVLVKAKRRPAEAKR